VVYFPENVIEDQLAKRFQANDTKGFTAASKNSRNSSGGCRRKGRRRLVERLKI
jgi:hypothetical protein